MNLFDKIFTPKKYVLGDGTEVFEKRSRSIIIIPLIVLFTYYSAKATGFSLKDLISNISELQYIIGRIFNVNFKYIPKVLAPLLETIKMSLLGSFLGAFVAIPFSYWASTNMTKSVFINWLVRFIFSILRTVPTIINALVATFIFGIGSVAGTIAIFIYSFSYVGKILYEQIENANMGAFEALMSMGYTRNMAFVKAIVPQVLPTFLSTALYNFEGNVRYAAILGYVGAGGIGVLMNHNIGLREYENLGAILLCVLVTIVIIENISIYFRKKLV